MTYINRDWWRGAALYQIYPRSFRDTNGDGIGDLAGITEHLGYIADLGVDAVWISPFFTSPMRDFGYDVSDYCGVDPTFGTIEDFDRLTARAHALGLKVMIDQVWSHTSDEHPWFIESRMSRDNPKADWFVWADPRPDGTAPNNWLSVFGGTAWTWDPRRCQYYLHHFLDCQPQLNLRNEAVLQALFESAEFWIAHGVDGFRFDAVDFMLHDAALRDNPSRPPPGGKIPSKPFGLQEHRYDMVQPEIGQLMERFRHFTDRYPAIATLGEVSSQEGALQRIQVYTGSDGTRLHMAYTLATMKRGFSKRTIVDAIEEANTHLQPDGWLCWAFSNHDVDRAASRWHAADRPETADAFARMLAVLMLSLRGSVCIYQGEELGLPHVDIPFEQMRDPYGLNFYPAFAGRDGARTPMPWDHAAPHAGFSTAEPWLPVPDSHRALAVDLQDREGSVLSLWRRFLAWRREEPALRSGELRLMETEPAFLAFERSLGNTRILALFNLTPDPATMSRKGLPAFSAIRDWSTGAGEADGITLPAYGYAFGYAR